MPKLLHIGIHESKNKNAGDTVLFPVVRKLFEHSVEGCTWGFRQLWEPFTVADALEVNQKYDGIVIGGGGLLLKDQVGSDTSNSGWQWNSELDAVKVLTIPIYVFAVGYNRFRGQEDFDPIFSDHITETMRASRFFSLRNSGSIAEVKNYVPRDLHGRITLQQCPTTVLWQLYPQFNDDAGGQNNTRPILTLNTAFDRESLRFGETKTAVLETLARSMKRAQDNGWKIHLVAHKTKDLEVAPVLAEQHVDFETFNLTESPYLDVIDYYTLPDLVVGMRGHAQMIPFGMRKPIFSIISHNKMRYFLDDIEHSDWGCDVAHEGFKDNLDAFIDVVFNDRDQIQKKVVEAQTKCWEKTRTNMNVIARSLTSNT